MPDDASFHIEGLDELQAALVQFPDEVRRGLAIAMRVASEKIRAGVAVYPAATGANMPPGLNGYSWYERGFGTRTVTGRTYPTSEALGRSWAVKVAQTAQMTRGTIGTTVSYAQFVQGKLQTGFHRARGWKTVEQVLFVKRGEIWRVFGDVVKRAMAKIAAKGGG